jgi:hypothetical protein
VGEIGRQREIEDVFFERPHVVVLGAGASIAAVPRDRNGLKLPDMRGLASLPEIADLFGEADIADAQRDFEGAYARLRADGQYEEIGDRIDASVRDFFAAVQIGDEPTIYDHLLLGLRSKDLVATFNWDPLMVQAEMRLRLEGVESLPQVVFLHGNVAIYVCLADAKAGLAGERCPTCGEELEPSPLLYPVTEKNYEDNDFIKHAWDRLRWGLEQGRIVTAFGYRAPVTDVAAIAEFQHAWGTPEQRQFEQFEFIVRPGSSHDQARERWDAFVHTHHYDVWDDFFESWIAKHPRRTGEVYYWQYIEANFVDENPIPRGLDLPSTVEWYRELMLYEEQAAASGS